MWHVPVSPCGLQPPTNPLAPQVCGPPCAAPAAAAACTTWCSGLQTNGWSISRSVTCPCGGRRPRLRWTTPPTPSRLVGTVGAAGGTVQFQIGRPVLLALSWFGPCLFPSLPWFALSPVPAQSLPAETSPVLQLPPPTPKHTLTGPGGAGPCTRFSGQHGPVWRDVCLRGLPDVAALLPPAPPTGAGTGVRGRDLRHPALGFWQLCDDAGQCR